MPKLPTQMPNRRKFNGKWFDLDYVTGVFGNAYRQYIQTIKKRGYLYRIVSKTYPGFGTYRGVYVLPTRKPIPEDLSKLRRVK